VSEDESNYDVLGVEPSASKDEIREAYRERLTAAQADVTTAETAKRPDSAAIAKARDEEARVRSAWQILSDPAQRSRHDERVGVSEADRVSDDDVEVLDDDDEDSTPAVRTDWRGRPLAPDAPDAPRRPPGLFSTERPPTPPSWPPGFHPPPPRARLLSLGIDVVVLALLIVLQQTLGGLLIDQAYPKETKQLDRIEVCLDRLETAKDDLDAPSKRTASIERANAACGRVQNVPSEPISTEGTKNRLENQLDNRIEKVEEKQTDLRNDILPGQLIVSLVTIVLALLYLVPSTMRSGRTLGKKLMQLRLVNIDGSPVRFRAATLHYGAPVMVALLFAPILGPLGYVAVLFGVLTWPRNANYQGLHDRLAGTIVVDG